MNNISNKIKEILIKDEKIILISKNSKYCLSVKYDTPSISIYYWFIRDKTTLSLGPYPYKFYFKNYLSDALIYFLKMDRNNE